MRREFLWLLSEPQSNRERLTHTVALLPDVAFQKTDPGDCSFPAVCLERKLDQRVARDFDGRQLEKVPANDDL